MLETSLWVGYVAFEVTQSCFFVGVQDIFVLPMAVQSWPYFDPEYETLSSRINPPR
jgi:hypothetical protein